LGFSGAFNTYYPVGHIAPGGWQVKLCDPSLTRANLSALEMNVAHIINWFTAK